MAYIELFNPAVIELQKELALHHPTVCRVLALMETWEERLAAIATHCEAKMDGEYSVEQIHMVIERLIPLLQDRREVP